MPTKKTLAEQILALSDPQPASFHPDEELLADETAAKVCDFSYEREGGEEARVGVGVRRKKRLGPVEEDPRYAGKVVSRKDLEFNQSPSPGEGENLSKSGNCDTKFAVTYICNITPWLTPHFN